MPWVLSGVKPFEIKYSIFIRPEDRALLESNLSAAAGDEGGAGLGALPFFSAPPDSP
jgi:hypothetical protein